MLYGVMGGFGGEMGGEMGFVLIMRGASGGGGKRAGGGRVGGWGYTRRGDLRGRIGGWGRGFEISAGYWG